MNLESMVRDATNEVQKGIKLVETGVKKAWSILEAAEQKKSPGEYLSQTAIQSMQGKPQG
jgi:hypothetical protein